MGGYVYLIGEIGNEGNYKIGSTRNKDIQKRLKQLQTGNSNELFLRGYFKTDKPFILEKMMHNKFYSKNVLNEWYELSDDEVNSFVEECERCQEIMDSLQDNPFFNKK